MVDFHSSIYSCPIFPAPFIEKTVFFSIGYFFLLCCRLISCPFISDGHFFQLITGKTSKVLNLPWLCLLSLRPIVLLYFTVSKCCIAFDMCISHLSISLVMDNDVAPYIILLQTPSLSMAPSKNYAVSHLKQLFPGYTHIQE